VPEGCVFVDLPEISRTVKALGIEYAIAMHGFRNARDRPVPEVRGIVVLKEDEAILRGAHQQQMEKKLLAKSKSSAAETKLAPSQGLELRQLLDRLTDATPDPALVSAVTAELRKPEVSGRLDSATASLLCRLAFREIDDLGSCKWLRAVVRSLKCGEHASGLGASFADAVDHTITGTCRLFGSTCRTYSCPLALPRSDFDKAEYLDLSPHFKWIARCLGETRSCMHACSCCAWCCVLSMQSCMLGCSAARSACVLAL
jgi:hypothetical protein